MLCHLVEGVLVASTYECWNVVREGNVQEIRNRSTQKSTDFIKIGWCSSNAICDKNADALKIGRYESERPFAPVLAQQEQLFVTICQLLRVMNITYAPAYMLEAE